MESIKKPLKLLRWPTMIIGTTIVIGSRILDAIDAMELGLPYDVWFIIGLAVFFIAVILLLLQFQKQSSGKIEGADIQPSVDTIQARPHKYIADSYIKGRVIYLMDLLAPGARPIISNRTIEDCEIRGPAMIAPLQGGMISEGTFDGDIESLFVEVPDKRVILGAIGLQKCVFRRCRFTQIGIIGTREQIEKAKQGFNPSTPHKGDSQN